MKLQHSKDDADFDLGTVCTQDQSIIDTILNLVHVILLILIWDHLQ